MLKPVKDLDEYKRIKQALRDKFDAERTGDQYSFVEQSKLFKPLIQPLLASQQQAAQQTIKAIQERQAIQERPPMPAIMGENDVRLASSSTSGSANKLSDLRSGQPAQQHSSSNSEHSAIKIDLDSGLDDTDIQNLEDMAFDLPSEVFKNKQIKETLNQIKTENRSIGQKLGKSTSVSEQDKIVYSSRKETLSIYKQIIQGLEGAKQFVGEGVDVIFYQNVEDLSMRLKELIAAKKAGNTGLDNRINAVLDELLRIQAISKDNYDQLYKLIFIK